MWPWLWWELWWRTAMLSFEVMATASRKPSSQGPCPAESEADEPPVRNKEAFLVSRLRTELEVKSVEDLIEGRGR